MLAGDLQTQIAGKPAESLARSPPEDGDSSDQTVPVQAKPASLAPGTPEEAVSGPNPPPRGPRLARKRKSEGPAHLVVLGGDEDAKKIRVVGDSAAARDQLKQRPEAAHVGLSVARSDSPKSGTNVSSDSTFAMVPKKEVTSQIEQMNRPHAARRLLGPSRLTGDRDEDVNSETLTDQEFEDLGEDDVGSAAGDARAPGSAANDDDDGGAGYHDCEDDDQEYAGHRLVKKLSAMAQSLRRKKSPKAEVTKNWVALLTAVEREVVVNSVTMRHLERLRNPEDIAQRNLQETNRKMAAVLKKKARKRPVSVKPRPILQPGAPMLIPAAQQGHAAAVAAQAPPALDANVADAEGADFGSEGLSNSLLVKKVAGICCHHCQRGKELARCSRQGCRLHYCTECIKRCYPGMTVEECMDKCPRCRGICNCKYALRMDKRCNKVPKTVGRPPAYSREQREAHQALMRRTLEGCGLGEVLGRELDEIRAEGERLGQPGLSASDLEVRQDAGLRTQCTECSSTICCTLRTSKASSYNLCPKCCGEQRARAGGADPCCPVSNEIMGLQRLGYFGGEAVQGCCDSFGGPEKEGREPEACGPAAVHVVEDASALDEGFFAREWASGSPFRVGGVRGQMLWTPHLMKRAATEKKKGEYTTDVIDCSLGDVIEVSIEAFFNGYTGETYFEGNPMYCLKSWPSEKEWNGKLKRLYMDFQDMLPCKSRAHPQGGLNLLGMLPESLRPEVGPRAYIGYGRTKEEPVQGGILQEDGDSTWKLNLQPLDNVFVNVHVSKSDAGFPGSLWHVFSREDTEKLAGFLVRNAHRFSGGRGTNSGVGASDVMSQRFYLSGVALELLKHETGVVPWVIEQKVDEALMIPAGCAYQVRNLCSCIRVGQSFVSPESAAYVAKQGSIWVPFAAALRLQTKRDVLSEQGGGG